MAIGSRVIGICTCAAILLAGRCVILDRLGRCVPAKGKTGEQIDQQHKDTNPFNAGATANHWILLVKRPAQGGRPSSVSKAAPGMVYWAPIPSKCRRWHDAKTWVQNDV